MNTMLPVCLALGQGALHSQPGSGPLKEKEAAEQQNSL